MPTPLPCSLTFFLFYISSFSLLYHQFCPCYQIIPSSLRTYSSEGSDSRKSMTLLGGRGGEIHHYFHFPCGHSDFTILYPTFPTVRKTTLTFISDYHLCSLLLQYYSHFWTCHEKTLLNAIRQLRA